MRRNCRPFLLAQRILGHPVDKTHKNRYIKCQVCVKGEKYFFYFKRVEVLVCNSNNFGFNKSVMFTKYVWYLFNMFFTVSQFVLVFSLIWFLCHFKFLY